MNNHQNWTYFLRAAAKSDSGLGDIKKDVCLANAADPDDGILRSMGSPSIKWKFSQR